MMATATAVLSSSNDACCLPRWCWWNPAHRAQLGTLEAGRAGQVNEEGDATEASAAAITHLIVGSVLRYLQTVVHVPGTCTAF